ncbi:phosphatase PAP2 family protein [Paraburkholderia phymatum]|uniref:Phosphoesterase PA-phosphatase related n=1 Tax=Paraburkholderia phymatum (strain DSM 17167 / CIP 108236 / LMG 21445 / STM815) TaxID=391038 RepID=B2JX20_PARP8|nr:phosphatase PAP2 family protein [Paraburkholderia phymatum]ACC75497.1 phosphoesterase PA-phosphatase related [Paraburkholderia phymatum STM815]
MHTTFDLAIQMFLSQHAFASPAINHLVRVISGQVMFKGLVLMPMLCFIWFRQGDRKDWEREMVIATVASGIVSLAVGRVLAVALPFRLRPISDPALHGLFPSVGLDSASVTTWSSFPSDHAMLWIAVATGIFLIWRSAGTVALLYTAAFICFPRVFVGLHHPTDILAGAAIGILFTYIATRDAVRQRFATPILRWMERSPGVGYTLALLLVFELVTQFDETLHLLHATTRAL